MADIIFFALVAAFIAWRLKSVLGRNVEIERKKPSTVTPIKPVFVKPQESAQESLAAKPQPPADDKIQKYPSELASVLRNIVGMDSSFSVDSFLKGAGIAFEFIVKAASTADEVMLSKLLKPDVLVIFKEALSDRKARNVTEETTLIAIKSADIVGATLRGTVAAIRVKFVSEQVKVTRDSTGKIVDGDPSLVEQVEDAWVFERDLRSGNPNWLLAEAE